jgi:hypothetical protein
MSKQPTKYFNAPKDRKTYLRWYYKTIVRNIDVYNYRKTYGDITLYFN